VSAAALAPAAPGPLLSGSVDPKAFGTQDHTISVFSLPSFHLQAYNSLSPCCEDCPARHAYAGLDLPAGSIIDYIGVNTATAADASMGFTLHFRDHLGGTAPLVSFSFPSHGYQTDYAGPLGILIPANVDRTFVLEVEYAPGVDACFGYVEVWWRRAVPDPPAIPTFADVPASHPFFQFIEALGDSGITGGCGGNHFCPDAPLTRGQMAVFLAKALGLHWSY
jgi:hypothetical protein